MEARRNVDSLAHSERTTRGDGAQTLRDDGLHGRTSALVRAQGLSEQFLRSEMCQGGRGREKDGKRGEERRKKRRAQPRVSLPWSVGGDRQTGPQSQSDPVDVRAFLNTSFFPPFRRGCSLRVSSPRAALPTGPVGPNPPRLACCAPRLRQSRARPPAVRPAGGSPGRCTPPSPRGERAVPPRPPHAALTPWATRRGTRASANTDRGVSHTPGSGRGEIPIREPREPRDPTGEPTHPVAWTP